VPTQELFDTIESALNQCLEHTRDSLDDLEQPIK